MMRITALLILALSWAAAPATMAREVVDASDPQDISVSIYRDPNRGTGQELQRNNPRGFAMVSETRTVTLPVGESTIRFIGVAEGMVAVTAIVTGLPGGTIEKNRNAELLSPAALVNGALGNRVTITRTNPGTGKEVSEEAIVRTRADGGLVLQSSVGYEVVRCAGLPEKLTFNRVPDGLSAKPVYSVDTRSDTGGTYEVTLTYLSWGFDWQANYVATLLPEQEQRKRRGDEFEMNWLSWLTLVNDNGQSFDNAQLQIIAGRLNIQSDFQGLSDPPVASPLRLTCYPIGSTKTGSPVPRYDPVPPPPPPPPPAYSPQAITVTGSRLKRSEMADLAVAVSAVETASEENLGDLKLYRVPRRVDVSAQAMKQVAFLNKDEVKVRYLYLAYCDAYDWIGDTQTPLNTEVLLVTKNEDKKGLGIALPQGAMKLFEPTSRGSRLAATADLRDYGRGQDIELNLGESAQVFSQCGRTVDEDFDDESRKWVKMITRLTNANPDPVKVRVDLGWPSEYDVRVRGRKVRVKNGSQVVEVSVPGNDTLEFRWKLRSAIAD